MGKIKHIIARDKLHKTPITNPSELPSTIDYPIFCLRHLSSKFCLTKCNKDEVSGFAHTLRILSQQSWSIIISNHVKGCEKIKNPRSMKEAVPKGITEDLPIIAFCFDGRKKMVGCRNGCIFHVIWLDPKFQLYAHGS